MPRSRAISPFTSNDQVKSPVRDSSRDASAGARNVKYLDLPHSDRYKFRAKLDFNTHTATVPRQHDGYPRGEVMDGGKSVYKFSERSFFDLRPGMRIRVTVTMFLID